MKSNALCVVRANLILFAFVLMALESLCLTLGFLSGRMDLIGLPLVRLFLLATSFLISLFVKHRARLAFDHACDDANLTWRLDAQGMATPIIDSHFRSDWLVQLHIEAHPDCARRAARAVS